MSIKFEVDPLSLAAFQYQMKRFATILKKDAPKALKVGTTYFCRSMIARTKISPMRREIVENPNPRAGIDKRVATHGVIRYRNGKPVFVPIYRGGQYGAIYRFVGMGNVEMLGRRVNGKPEYIPYSREDALEGANLPSLKKHKKTIIYRSGMAKLSWNWILRSLYGKSVKGNIRQPGGSIFTNKGGSGYGAFVRFKNNLRYVTSALKGSPSAVMSEAFVAASNQIRKAVERSLAKGGAKKR